MGCSGQGRGSGNDVAEAHQAIDMMLSDNKLVMLARGL